MRKYVSLALILVSPVFAKEKRHHHSHEHGISKMSMVLEKDSLTIDHDVPGMNILGFEHPPSTDKDKEAFSKAMKDLRESSNFITFNKEATCIQATSVVKKSAKKGEHSEFEANYMIHCQYPEHIKSAIINFSKVPNTKTYKIEYVIHGKQGSKTASPENPEVVF